VKALHGANAQAVINKLNPVMGSSLSAYAPRCGGSA
jgi:hypothetical protein